MLRFAYLIGMGVRRTLSAETLARSAVCVSTSTRQLRQVQRTRRPRSERRSRIRACARPVLSVQSDAGIGRRTGPRGGDTTPSTRRASSKARRSTASSSRRKSWAASTSRCWRPTRARARSSTRRKWTGYDVVLDVWPDVFAWGVLVVPKDLQPGERRPVVVCQHGRNGAAAGHDRCATTRPTTTSRPAWPSAVHHLRAAQPLPRRRPLPLARPQGQHRQGHAVLLHHRAARPDPALAGDAAVRRRPAASRSTV